MNSYEFQNKVRDLAGTFSEMIVGDAVLTNFISTNGVATSTKHEWLEDVVTAKAWTLGAAYVAASGALVLVSTVGVKAGDVLGFKLATGASVPLQLKVTSVTNATDLVVAVYASTTDANMANGTSVKLISRPQNEGSTGTADNSFEPTVAYNYTQIFDRTAKVSKTSQNVNIYGLEGAIDYEVSRQLQDLKYELINAIVYGRRVQRSGSEAGTMGGILYFLETAATAGATNTIAAGGAALSTTILNNAFTQGYKNGAQNLKAILCGPVQARKISAFNTSGQNPVITKSESSTIAGSYVSQFVSDLPVAGGLVSTIIVEQNFPEDKIVILDLDRVAFIPLQNRGFQDMDATLPGADYIARRVLGEYTLEVKNAANAHILISGLAL